MRRHVIVLVGSLALALPALAEVTVRVGSAYPDIIQQWGQPGRIIQTGDGTILFYGQTLLFVTNGVIDFISVGDGGAAAALPLAPAPLLAPPPRTPLFGLPTAALLPVERKDILDGEARRREERNHQRIAGRIKRVAITHGYAALRAEFLRLTPPPGIGDVLGIKDAQGRASPTLGNSSAQMLPMMGIDVHTFVMGP